MQFIKQCIYCRKPLPSKSNICGQGKSITLEQSPDSFFTVLAFSHFSHFSIRQNQAKMGKKLESTKSAKHYLNCFNRSPYNKTFMLVIINAVYTFFAFLNSTKICKNGEKLEPYKSAKHYLNCFNRSRYNKTFMLIIINEVYKIVYLLPQATSI